MTSPLAAAPLPRPLHPSVLREYDIRGIVGETLHPDDAMLVGRAFATHLAERLGRQPVLCVGRDGRLSSPELARSLIAGLTACGAQVRDIGVGPTPMLYFAAHHSGADGGIMVTGSHNPPTHNGFKMVAYGQSFYGRDIAALGERIAAGRFTPGSGAVTPLDMAAAYTEALLSALLPGGTALTIAWDPGNGAAGEMVERLRPHLPGTHHAINTAIDGHFPNHHPDPSQEKNLVQIKKLVAQTSCDAGFAFDGDADRLGLVDDKGRTVSPDHLLMLLARDVLQQRKGTIIADVKTSGLFFDDVRAHGGEPLMWMTGHSHIKAKMKAIGSPFGGEASGHIFFADRYFGFDDGLYAGLRVLNLLAHSDKPLSALIDALPRAFSTPEIRLDCPEERKFVVIEEVRARLEREGTAFNAIDGVRVETPAGWWLIRASNTQAAIIARAEAFAEADLPPLTETLRRQLAASGVSLDESSAH